jgi:hypothetical protein
MGLGLGMKIDDHGNAVPGSTTGMSSALPADSYGMDPNF